MKKLLTTIFALVFIFITGENLAKKTQEIKIADSERTQYMSYALIVITNIYQNPLYKTLGPEMNKMLAESRCNRIGTQSFMTELLESMP